MKLMNIRFKNKKSVDIKNNKKRSKVFFSRRKKVSSVLFSKGKISESFFTEDSKLYITPCEQKLLRKGIKLNRDLKKWDSLSSRIVRDFIYYKPKKSGEIAKTLEEKYEIINDSLSETSRSFLGQFSLMRLWNFSIVGSILLGMFMMTFVYRYLGQGASAQQASYNNNASRSEQSASEEKVLGAEFSHDDVKAFNEQFLEIEKAENEQALREEITKMVKGYPIEKMVPYIAKKDRTVAAFLVAIAKKESNWGKRAPVLKGQECYNFWGYRGLRRLMGTGGHTCFNSQKDAVDTVAKRIENLIKEYGRNTPKEMIVWKCGSDCSAAGGQAAANKWISDVAMYFNELNEKE